MSVLFVFHKKYKMYLHICAYCILKIYYVDFISSSPQIEGLNFRTGNKYVFILKILRLFRIDNSQRLVLKLCINDFHDVFLKTAFP